MELILKIEMYIEQLFGLDAQRILVEVLLDLATQVSKTFVGLYRSKLSAAMVGTFDVCGNGCARQGPSA